MKKVKDNFSIQSKLYAQFRPTYPDALYDYLYALVPQADTAWDCGTGNGQVASRLSEKFRHVYATDISERQLAHAQKRDNIQYVLSRAEETSFQDNTFDLTTVGQALHWFDFSAFFQEVKRTSKGNAVVAVWGYGLLRCAARIDPIVDDFYKNVTGPYWDKERIYIDKAYKNISFPFEEMKAPHFTIEVKWGLTALEGFFNTWSSVQKYMKQHGRNPVPELMKNIRQQWDKDELRVVKFPVFMRVGRVRK